MPATLYGNHVPLKARHKNDLNTTPHLMVAIAVAIASTFPSFLRLDPILDGFLPRPLPLPLLTEGRLPRGFVGESLLRFPTGQESLRTPCGEMRGSRFFSAWESGVAPRGTSYYRPALCMARKCEPCLYRKIVCPQPLTSSGRVLKGTSVTRTRLCRTIGGVWGTHALPQRGSSACREGRERSNRNSLHNTQNLTHGQQYRQENRQVPDGMSSPSSSIAAAVPRGTKENSVSSPSPSSSPSSSDDCRSVSKQQPKRTRTIRERTKTYPSQLSLRARWWGGF